MTRYVIPIIAIPRHDVLSEIQANVTVTLKIHVTMVTDISDLYLFTIDTLLMSWRMLIVRQHTTYHVRRTSYDIQQVIFRIREVWPYEKFRRIHSLVIRRTPYDVRRISSNYVYSV